MKTLGLTLGLILGLLSVSRGQDSYTVSGRVRGLQTGKVCLVAADFGKADTLASAAVENGGFLLTGSLPGGVRAVNLFFDGVEGQLPVLLEHTTYQVSVTAQGAAIEGEGAESKLLKKFERIGRDYATEQYRIRAEYESGEANDARLRASQTQLDNAYRESVRKTHELLQANADSYVAAYVIALGMAGEEEAVLQAKYDLLGKGAKNTVPGKAIALALERYGKLVAGEEAPNLTLSKPDGNTFTLHGVPAKWKLVHFWSSENPVSRQLTPELVRLYYQYRPKGLEIVSVSLDSDRFAWRKAVGMDGMTWTNGSDLQGPDASEATRLYLVGELPAFFLLDGENKIVARDLSLDDLRAKLAELTKKKRK